MRNYYLYNVVFNLEHPILDNYPLKVNLNANSIELESQHFTQYQECVDDCHKLIKSFVSYLSEQSPKADLEMGWEANPNRMKDAPHMTKEWEPEEIVHLFVFEKSNVENYIVKCTVVVRAYDEELIPFVD